MTSIVKSKETNSNASKLNLKKRLTVKKLVRENVWIWIVKFQMLNDLFIIIIK